MDSHDTPQHQGTSGRGSEPVALEEEHEALLAFLYAAPVGLVQTDLNGQVEMMNAVTAMLLMPLATQQTGGLDNLFDLLHPLAPDLPERVAALGSALGPICDDLRLSLSSPDESPKYGALRLVKLDAHRLIATITDITPQVLAELGRKQAEDRLRFALDAAHVGDWSLDVESGRMEGAPMHNRGFDSAMLDEGWHLQELLERVHPDDRSMVQSGLEAAVRESGPWRSEFRVLWTDASEHWLALHGRPVHRSGEPPQFAGVILDTTPEREADAMRQRAAELEAENERLLDASRQRGKFVATMSHELRSPLTSIIGFAELLRSGLAKPGTADHAECLDRIAGNGQHLLRLINDVLDLSKVEAGKLRFKPASLDLLALAADVRATMSALWEAKQQSFELDIDEGLDGLFLDGLRMRQVLYNLVSNAIKFTPQRGRISVQARGLPGDLFELCVSDDGIGIAEADLPRLFRDFQQLDNHSERSYEGTGLGLALSQRLVQAQGGTITVDSTVGQGTIFRITQPRRHPATCDDERVGVRVLTG